MLEGIGESIGNALASVGESCLQSGIDGWEAIAKVTKAYCLQDPTSYAAAWGVVNGVYNTMLAVGASLMTLYFVIGWLRESIDIRNNFTMENMFRFFVRLAVTSGLLTTAYTLIRDVMILTATLAGTFSFNVTSGYSAEKIFEPLLEGLEGWELLGPGLLCMLGGLVGMAIMLFSGIMILISVLNRLFKVFLCIPFAPTALASFAGGAQLGQSGTAWIKTFLAYCLEIIVIMLSLTLAAAIFKDNANVLSSSKDGWSGVVLKILNLSLPMLTAYSCSKGGEGIIRKSLGL